jgi:RND family efflux transporter MFP subunit
MTETPRDLSRLTIDRGERRGSSRSGWVAFALLLAAATGFVGWRTMRSRSGRLPEVTLGRVERRGGATAQSGVAANGYVVARKRAALSTDIQGRVVEIAVEEGMRVKAGQLVARLDTSERDAALARTRADLERARAAARLARLSFDRAEALARSGHGSIAAEDEARAGLEEADAQVLAIAAAEREIRSQIAKSVVSAPFDGVITQKNAEVGEVVSSLGAGGNSRGSVATLVDFDTLEVQVELAQTSLRAAREGAPVLIYLDAYPEDGYRGKVRQIWPTADRQKASVELRCEFIERDARILPEMGARVVFVPESAAEARPAEVLLPKAALVAGPDPYVLQYRGREDAPRTGTLSRRPVTLGGTERDGRIPIANGLTGNELVVLDPPPALADGAQVREKEEKK